MIALQRAICSVARLFKQYNSWNSVNPRAHSRAGLLSEMKAEDMLFLKLQPGAQGQHNTAFQDNLAIAFAPSLFLEESHAYTVVFTTYLSADRSHCIL